MAMMGSFSKTDSMINGFIATQSLLFENASTCSCGQCKYRVIKGNKTIGEFCPTCNNITMKKLMEMV